MVPLMRVARSIPPRAHATTFVYTFRSAHSHRRLLPVHYQFPRGHVCPPVRRVWSCGLRRGCQASTAIAYSFNREFGPVIKRQINYFSKTGGSGGDKMAAVRGQVEEVKGVMVENIGKLAHRPHANTSITQQ